jgi:hypothetical protein
VAFRDPTTALRDQLEAAEKELATLRAQNAELSAGQRPLLRSMGVALGVTVVLGLGVIAHLAMQNRGLEAVRREQDETVSALRRDLDTHRHGRELAESALLAEQAEARDRAQLERDRAASLQAEAWRAGPSRPPNPAEPTRLFWVTSASGREDLSEGSTCEVTIHQHLGERGQNTCGVAVSCRDRTELEVLRGGMIPCRARPDGWVDASATVEGVHASFAGPRVTLSDAALGWSLTMTNRRPCGG